MKHNILAFVWEIIINPRAPPETSMIVAAEKSKAPENAINDDLEILTTIKYNIEHSIKKYNEFRIDMYVSQSLINL